MPRRKTPKLTIETKGRKIRDVGGEVVGECLTDLIITLDSGAPKGGRGTGGGFPAQDGQPQALEQGPTDAHGQETLDLPESLVARVGERIDPAGEIWAHYCRAMNPRNHDLDKETRTILNAALKVATIQECKDAISACAGSDFHMGHNDRRRKYNQVSQILKGKRGRQTARERIDFFLELGEKTEGQPEFPSGNAAKISNAKQDVRDAHEMPGDEHVARRGKESEEYLVALGWTIQRDDTGWPTFTRPA